MSSRETAYIKFFYFIISIHTFGLSYTFILSLSRVSQLHHFHIFCFILMNEKKTEKKSWRKKKIFTHLLTVYNTLDSL